MPTIITRGAVSAQALGYATTSAVAEPVYVEDVFSTYLITGTGAAQTITNGIDLSTKGGFVWVKTRTVSADHFLFDTERGPLNEINSNTTGAQASLANSVTAFNTTGFDVGSALPSGLAYASWTFRKQAKFFDIVTYTGTGVARTVAHSLGSVPGCIMVKRTDTTSDWRVYHRSLTSAAYFVELNTSDSESTTGNPWNSTTPTSSVFSLGTAAEVNASGGTYVAYLFAHDAGGFGEFGTDNVISCGLFNNSSGLKTGPIITLGWQPQWLLIKSRNSSGNWIITDTTRKFSVGLTDTASTHNSPLFPNTLSPESTLGLAIPRSNGFQIFGDNSINAETSGNCIYIAIRKDPMKVPTVGTQVLGLNSRTGTGANATVTGGQFDDLAIIKNTGAVQSAIFANRLTNTGYMSTTATTAETAAGTTILQANPWDVMDGIKVGTTSAITNASANTFINYLLRRAPQVYDSLAYIFPATLVANTRIPHNLTIPPEMIIAKTRSSALGWYVYHKDIGINAYVRLNVNNTQVTSTGMWGATAPTATDFGVNPSSIVAASANAMFHLFATCPGVSKVGGYNGAGVGTPQQIDCGFTTGARFVLIKARNGIAGDWYLWDSARGIVAGNDPYFLVNSTAAEVTTTDYIDTYSAGFELSATAPAALNNTGYSYIFLAIA